VSAFAVNGSRVAKPFVDKDAWKTVKFYEKFWRQFILLTSSFSNMRNGQKSGQKTLYSSLGRTTECHRFRWTKKGDLQKQQTFPPWKYSLPANCSKTIWRLYKRMNHFKQNTPRKPRSKSVCYVAILQPVLLACVQGTGGQWTELWKWAHRSVLSRHIFKFKHWPPAKH